MFCVVYKKKLSTKSSCDEVLRCMNVRRPKVIFRAYRYFGCTVKYTLRCLTSAAGSSVSNTSDFNNRHILDATLFYEKNNDNESLYKIPNRDTSMTMNSFFHSLVVGNTSKAKENFVKLMHKTKRSPTINNVNICCSCLSILLAHMSTSATALSVLDVKVYHEQLIELENNMSALSLPQETLLTISAIKHKIVHCLIKAFGDIPSTSTGYKYNVASYILQVIKDFGLSPETIINDLDDINILETFNKLLQMKGLYCGHKIKKSIPDTHIHSSICIDDYKDVYGLLSLKSLCDYISTVKYEHKDKKFDGMKLFEAYDRMTFDERKFFLSQYLEFNTSKELEIESVSLDLIDSSIFKSRKSVTSKSSEVFKRTSSNLLHEWYMYSLENVNQCINECIVNHENLSKRETKKGGHEDHDSIKECISENLFILQSLPIQQLILAVISNIFTKTIESETGYVKVVDLVASLQNHSRRLLYKNPSSKGMREELVKYFHNENSVRLLSALITIVLKSCKLKSDSIDIQKFGESFALVQASQSEIDHDFFKEVSGSYDAFKWGLMNQSENKFKLGIIKIHPYLLQNFKASIVSNLTRSLYLPMLVPAKSWKSPLEGGYVTDLKPLVNSVDQDATLEYLKEAHKTSQLNPTYQALDILGSCAWAINNKVLNVFNSVMQLENGFLKIPAHLDSLRKTYLEKASIVGDENANQTFDRRKRLTFLKDFHNRKSLRINYEMIQSVANAYGYNGDMLYLPHNIDFRGRAYPMVSILSHYQEDLVRSLMMFWYSKPLGENGFSWLKYQLASLYGEDKLSKAHRLDFVDKNLKLILDSARHPLDGQMWWTKAEDPWQALSICIEINDILDYVNAGGKLPEYKCRIPIHQDGSCNGLQHYAALGRDKDGAYAVNLGPSNEMDKKQDVYSRVLEIVETKLKKDKNSRISDVQSLATASSEIINRKMIKQTVMTSVYGVTTYGGSAQIESRIDELIQNSKFRQTNTVVNNLDFIENNKQKLSLYLSGIVLGSVSELFNGARQIQKWLYDNCLRILYSFDWKTVESLLKQGHEFDVQKPLLFRPMMWTSISGLPIVQLYKNIKNTQIKTPLQRLKMNKPSNVSTINVQKQLNAFAPNFIHSLDSTHMLMSVTEASKQDLSFVSVHDSYWTHPSEVEKLAKIIRSEFVRLYNTDVLEYLREDMQYTAENKFQLIWIENAENPNLIDQIKTLRNTYFKERKVAGTINELLCYELEGLSKQKDTRCLDLVSEYNPTLYFKPRQSSRKLKKYFNPVENDEKPFSNTKYTPVLYPVKILPKPPTGDFEINEVMHSWYFFS